MITKTSIIDKKQTIKIRRSCNGKTVEELVNIWNEQHPDDPVE
ncbi:MAG: hypothetical protein PVH61_14655 [Candidatus Aminicenantes bacterium]